MKIQLIRHATLLVDTGAGRLLVDPMFSEKGAMPPIDNSANPSRNPLVELPVSISELLKVQAILLTHTHPDHFDTAAIRQIPKDRLLFCQPADEQKLTELGFTEVKVVHQRLKWNNSEIFRTSGQHGNGEIGKQMGPVSGYVLETVGQPKVYIAGDTIWCDEVEKALQNYRPEVVVVFAGSAQFLQGDPITMQTADVLKVLKAAPEAKVLVVHMESFNHCLLTREMLRQELVAQGVLERVLILENGETIEI